jgi:hypothetical protein
MNARIRVDLKGGIFEAEGSDDFVQRMYDDFKTSVRDALVTQPISSSVPPITPASKTRKKISDQRDVYQIVKDLDLMPKGKQSLHDFSRQYDPASNMEWNALFVYYLEQILSIPDITPSHIFTCYRAMRLPIPKALAQSLIDTASRKGWIDTASLDSMRLTIRGTNFVEHEIAKSADAS